MNQTTSEQFGSWLELIRAEYAEMPGLHLSKRQAQKLWRLDPESCDVLFSELEAAHFLRRTPTDAYIRADIGC
jgi:hypothetical protein